MEIKIDKKELLSGLSWTQSVVERKATMPILANCCLQAKGKHLTISATDLEVGVIAEHQSEVIKPGAVTVAARALFDIVKELPEDRVHLTVLNNNWVKIISGKSEFKIVGLDVSEYPNLPKGSDGETYSLEVNTFHDMITKTAHAMSTDETRYNLNGVFLESVKGGKGKSSLRLVATDGHRLAYTDREVKEKVKLEKGVIIPRKGILECKKLLDGIEGSFTLKIDAKYVTVHRDNVTLIIRLIDGQFPPYQQVIPKQNKWVISTERIALLQALRRVQLVTTDRARGVKFRLSPGHLEITAKNPDVGESHEELKVDYKGETVDIGFNARYFLDILNVIEDEQLVIELKGEMGPCVFRSEFDRGFLAVIMPMRL